VAILGATGVAGHQALIALARHPQFEIAAVAGSSRSAGRRLGDVLDGNRRDWQDIGALLAAPPAETAAADLPAALLDLRVQDVADFDAQPFAAVFSMLPSSVAREAEAACARHVPVFSTASAWRMDPDTPLLAVGVNGDHAALLERQQRRHGWRGFIAPGPNCTTVGLVVSLAPLQRAFGLRAVSLVSLQAVSGAGSKAPRLAAEVAANVLPHIAGEEHKVEVETRKILGRVAAATAGGAPALQPAEIGVSATCTRVPVSDGHLLAVSAQFGQPVSVEQARAVLAGEQPWRGRQLPSAPQRWIVVRDEDDRPQPRLDRDSGAGFTTVVGRLRPDPLHDGLKWFVLSHNTVLGAAGGAVLLAEDLFDRGLA